MDAYNITNASNTNNKTNNDAITNPGMASRCSSGTLSLNQLKKEKIESQKKGRPL